MPVPYDRRAKPKVAITGESGNVASFFVTDFAHGVPNADLCEQRGLYVKWITLEKALQDAGLTDPDTHMDFSRFPTRFDVIVEFRKNHLIVRSKGARKRFSFRGIFQDGKRKKIGDSYEDHERAKDALLNEVFHYIRYLLKRNKRPLSIHPVNV
jgi:hypothetical protein